MPLTRCAACGGLVSDLSTRCPGCGGPGPASAPPATEAAPPLPPIDPVARAARPVLTTGLLLAAGVVVAGLLRGGGAGELAVAGLEVIPFLVIGWLAYLGLRRRWARVTAWIGAVVLVLLTALGTLVGISTAYGSSKPLRDLLHAAMLAAALATVIALLFLIPGPRRLLSRAVGLDPKNPVHQIALFLTVALLLVFVAPLAGTGRPVLLDILTRARTHPSLAMSPDELLLPLLWTIPAAFVVVGYGTHRGWDAVVDRLGLCWLGNRPLVHQLRA